MALLILEALGALLLLGFIVWWTMFSGRRRGERIADPQGHDNERIGMREQPGRAAADAPAGPPDDEAAHREERRPDRHDER